MSDRENCPEPEVFADFLTGQLEEEQLQLVEAHLANCSACGDTLRSMHVDDTFVQLVSSHDNSESIGSGVDNELDDVMLRLASLADARSHRESQGASIDDLGARVYEVESLLGPSAGDDEIGRLGHYRVLRLLGTGGMGVVYQAEDAKLRRLVALKILRPSLGQAARDRFLYEARAAAAMDHDNVVTIFNVGSEGPLAYLAMQWLAGETLEDRLQRDERLSTEEVVRIGSQVADGLSAAHAQKLMHRDIKPANIWLEAGRDRSRILDFGLARVVDENPQLTETGMIAGTPAYMSPEQAQGQAVDERSDLFSLGTMLYRMLTGKLPFEASNALATIGAIQKETPLAPRQLDLNIPSWLSDLVMDLLEKDPRSRPGGAELVAESLRQGTRAVPRSAPTPATLENSGTGNRRWGMFLAMLFAFGGFLAAPWIYRVVTDRGEIVVKTNDPNIKVEVLQGGELIKVIDPKTGDTVNLRAGNYDLQIFGADSEVQLDRTQLTLRRKGREVVSVLQIEKSKGGDRVQPVQQPLVGEPPLPGDIANPYSNLNVSPTAGPIRPGARVKVQVSGAIPEAPIDGVYTIEPSGHVPLGPEYGRALVAGMNYEQAEAAITKKLQEILTDPKVQVTLPGDSPRGSAVETPLTRMELKRVNATEVVFQFGQLYPSAGIRMTVDSDGNLLVAGGSKQELKQLQDVVQELEGQKIGQSSGASISKGPVESEENAAASPLQLDVARIADCELRVIGIYSPKDHGKDDRVYVEIEATDKPLVLALTSYFAANWQLKLADGAKVKQIIVSGAMDAPLVEGVAKDISILRLDSGKERCWAYSLHSSQGRRLIKTVEALTHLPVATFQGQYSPRKITVGGDRGRLENSQDVIKGKGEDDFPNTIADIDKSAIADCQLQVVGIYGPQAQNDDRVNVLVEPTEEPIVLALTAYQSVNWQVKLAAGARVKQVIVAGYYQPVIEGIPDDIPIAFRTYFPHQNRDFFFGYAWHTTEGRKTVKRLQEMTGLLIATFQGAEQASSFVVDGKLGLREDEE